MKKFFKKATLVLLTLAVLCTALPAAFAAQPEQTNGLLNLNIAIIELDAQGGMGSELLAFTNWANHLNAMPTEPTLEGYRFLGWYDEPIGGNKITDETCFTESTTIYAQWEPELQPGQQTAQAAVQPEQAAPRSLKQFIRRNLGTILVAGMATAIVGITLAYAG